MLRVTSCKQHFMGPLLHIPELLATKRLYSNSCGLRDFSQSQFWSFHWGKTRRLFTTTPMPTTRDVSLCRLHNHLDKLLFSIEPNCLCLRRLCPCGRGWIDHKNWSVCPTHCLRPTVSWSGPLLPLRVCCYGKVRNTENIQLMVTHGFLFILGIILETKSN